MYLLLHSQNPYHTFTLLNLRSPRAEVSLFELFNHRRSRLIGLVPGPTVLRIFMVLGAVVVLLPLNRVSAGKVRRDYFA
jgi:hypothetical protein